jgi:PPOX class probable F420-dependent enzyme
MQTRFAELRDLLATGPLATVATIDPDGTPHTTLAWVGFDGDEIVMCTFFMLHQRKLSNMRRDPRVVLTVQSKEFTGQGLWPYAVIQCRVDRITDGGALAMMDRLAEYYIGPGAQYPMREVPEGVVVHLTIDRVYGQGPWVQGGGPARS